MALTDLTNRSSQALVAVKSISLDGFAWYRQTTPWDGNRSAGGLVDCTIIIGGDNRYRTSSRATLYRPGCARCRPDRLSLVHGLFHSSSLGADPYPTVPVHSIIIYVVALADLHTLRCSCRISYSLPCIWGYSQSRSRFKRRLGLLHSSDHYRGCYMSDRFVDKTHVQASHLTNR